MIKPVCSTRSYMYVLATSFCHSLSEADTPKYIIMWRVEILELRKCPDDRRYYYLLLDACLEILRDISSV